MAAASASLARNSEGSPPLHQLPVEINPPSPSVRASPLTPRRFAMALSRVLLPFFLGAAAYAGAANPAPPCSITVAFGTDPSSSATIAFASNNSAPAFVTLTPAVGGVSQFAAAASDNSYANAAGVRVIYRVVLEGLAPSTTYSYVPTVGTESARPRTFTTLSADPAAESPIVIFWGDLGRDGGGQAFPALEAEAARTAARAPGAGSVGIQVRGGGGFNRRVAVLDFSPFPPPLGWRFCLRPR